MSSDGKMRSFGLVLQSLEDGKLLDDLSAQLADLNMKILREAETHGKGVSEITLKLKLAADEGGAVTIDAVTSVKEPKPMRRRSMAWMTKDGVLLSENPKQQKLPLRSLDTPRGEPKDVPNERGAPRGV